jgi:hypothetical protein
VQLSMNGTVELLVTMIIEPRYGRAGDKRLCRNVANDWWTHGNKDIFREGVK